MIRSFDSNQDATLLKSSDSFCWSSLWSFAEVYMTVSSAYIIMSQWLKTWPTSSKLKRKSKGPKNDPCGTRHNTGSDFDNKFRKFTSCFLSKRWLIKNSFSTSCTPQFERLLMIWLWLNVSNALLKSVNIVPVNLPKSIFFLIESTKVVAAASVFRLLYESQIDLEIGVYEFQDGSSIENGCNVLKLLNILEAL